MNRSASVFAGISLSVAVLLGAASQATAQVVFGTVVSHNGRLDSNPAGTDEVNVQFSYPAVPGMISIYNEVATHIVDFTYAPGPTDFLRTSATIANSTGVPWAGFRIFLEGADFAGWDVNSITTALDVDPVIDTGFGGPADLPLAPQFLGLRHQINNFFTLDSSSIVRSNDQGSGPLDAELTITFGEPVMANGAFFLFYNVIPPLGDPTATGLTLFMTPIPVPEPATAALLLGVGSIGLVRRRRGAHA